MLCRPVGSAGSTLVPGGLHGDGNHQDRQLRIPDRHGQGKPGRGYTFVLDGTSYQIADVLEISQIATRHGYIVIY